MTEGELATANRALRRDLQQAQERHVHLQREVDRLQSLVEDTRNGHFAQLQSASTAQAAAETKLVRAEQEALSARSRVDRAEKDAAEAWARQKAQAKEYQDVRAQASQQLTSMVAAIAERDEEVHKLQHQLREAKREVERLAAADDTLHRRERSLQELTATYTELRTQNEATVAEVSVLRQTVESLRGQQRAAAEALERSETRARAASFEASHSTLAAAAAAAAAAGGGPPSPLGQTAPGTSFNGSAGAALPPPPVPTNDPHVAETAQLVSHFKDFAQESGRSILALEDLVEAHLTSLQDLRAVLERGSTADSSLGSGPTSPTTTTTGGATSSASQQLDRMRFAQLRRTEQREREHRLLRLAEEASTSAFLRGLMENVRFNVEKVQSTLGTVGDYTAQLRHLVDRHCGTAGLPAMHSRWEAWLKQRPEPLPMPRAEQQPVVEQQHRPSSDVQQPQSPAASPAVSTVVTSLQEQLEDVTAKLKTSRDAHEAASERLRSERNAHDESMERLRTEHRVALHRLEERLQEVRRDAADEIATVRREAEDTVRTANRKAADREQDAAGELQRLERERLSATAELRERVATLERKLEEAEQARMQDHGALQESETKRRQLKERLREARKEVEELSAAASDHARVMEEGHVYVDELEMKLEAAERALAIERDQNDQCAVDARGFAQWKRAVASSGSMELDADRRPTSRAPATARAAAVAAGRGSSTTIEFVRRRSTTPAAGTTQLARAATSTVLRSSSFAHPSTLPPPTR